MSSPVSCAHAAACGKSVGAGLYPVSCFFLVIYREIQGSGISLRRNRHGPRRLEQRQLGRRQVTFRRDLKVMGEGHKLPALQWERR